MPQIEMYLRKLDLALAPLQPAERRDILMETRSHLAERCACMGEAEALRRIGPADLLARQYVAVTCGADAHSPRARVWLDGGRWPSAALAVGASLLWILALVSGALSLAELAQPAQVSLWMNTSTGSLFVGAANPDLMARLNDIAGVWFLPVAAGLAMASGSSGLMLTRFIWQQFRKPFSRLAA